LDFASLTGGFVAEHFSSHISLQLYTDRAFKTVEWVNFIPPTLKACVFGLIIGTVSCFVGFTTNQGSEAVSRASSNSVALSSLLIIVEDVVLVLSIEIATILRAPRTNEHGSMPQMHSRRMKMAMKFFPPQAGSRSIKS
jgi:ABC-type transporter Mla maintaining outer membrane lipid asymmetry permease subunit MlaE